MTRTISVNLNKLQQIALHRCLEMVVRCGGCNTNLLAVEAPQHLRRHVSVSEKLGLEAFATPGTNLDVIAAKAASGDDSGVIFELEFEEARYLMGVLERRVRFSPTAWALAPLLVDLKTQLDVMFFAEDLGTNVVVRLTARQRVQIFSALNAGNQCVTCGTRLDGVEGLPAIQNLIAAVTALKLPTLFKVEDLDAMPAEDFSIPTKARDFLKSALEAAAPFLRQGPRAMLPIINLLEEAPAAKAAE